MSEDRKTKEMTPDMEHLERCHSYFEIAPAEALTGYLVRMALAGKLTNIQHALEYGADGARVSLGGDSWSYSPRTRESFEGKYALFSPFRAAEIVKKHTLEPLLRQVTDIRFARLLEWSISGNRDPGKYQYDDYIIERGFLKGQVALFCETCFREQTESLGFSYYRILWQLPMAAYCDVHKTPLRQITCRNCGLHPTRTDCFARIKIRICQRCGADTWLSSEEIDNPRRAQFHKWFVDLMDADIPPLTHELRRAIKREAFARRRLHENWYLVDKGQFAEVISGTGERAHRRIATKKNYSGREFRHFRRKWVDQDDFYWFWLPVINAFPVFEEFRKWLEDNSTLRTKRDDFIDTDVTFLSQCN